MGDATIEEEMNAVIINDHLKTVENLEAPEPEESDDARFKRWQSQRPSIDHLPDGMITGDGTYLPLFDIGDRIVVERVTTLLPNKPWLDTIVGKVRSIDDETGLVSVYDEDTDQRNPTVRFVSFGPAHRDHHVFKLAPKVGNPFDVAKVARAAIKEARVLADGSKPRGRGRPKGSKNRPKDVIKAEKLARREEKKR